MIARLTDWSEANGAHWETKHVRSHDPKLARRQDRFERPWGWIAGGCHPNRRTLQAIEGAGLVVIELEQRDLPDIPRLVRPNVLGFARSG